MYGWASVSVLQGRVCLYCRYKKTISYTHTHRAIHHGKWPDKTLWTNDAGQQAIQDDHQGSVMLHRDQAGMIYVKGIHVKNGSAPVGFDFDNLSLDRDRNTVTGRLRGVGHGV